MSAASEIFLHHVLFYPKAGASPADLAQLREGLQKMQQIPTIRLAHIGTPAATDRAVIDRGYAYSWLCLFASAADELAYQEHPIHDEFRRDYARYWDRVVIYDAVGPVAGGLAGA
jgi:hypothetical protein